MITASKNGPPRRGCRRQPDGLAHLPARRRASGPTRVEAPYTRVDRAQGRRRRAARVRARRPQKVASWCAHFVDLDVPRR